MEGIPNPYELETQSQRQNVVLPPITRRPPGRLKNRRQNTDTPDIGLFRCSRCHQIGHSRTTCRNPIRPEQ